MAIERNSLRTQGFSQESVKTGNPVTFKTSIQSLKKKMQSLKQ